MGTSAMARPIPVQAPGTRPVIVGVACAAGVSLDARRGTDNLVAYEVGLGRVVGWIGAIGCWVPWSARRSASPGCAVRVRAARGVLGPIPGARIRCQPRHQWCDRDVRWRWVAAGRGHRRHADGGAGRRVAAGPARLRPGRHVRPLPALGAGRPAGHRPADRGGTHQRPARGAGGGRTRRDHRSGRRQRLAHARHSRGGVPRPR
jgi:hypothetical protein